MKILGLMLVKNDAWILRTTLPSLLKFVDGLIALDGQSDDGSRDLLTSVGATILEQPEGPVDFSSWRDALLRESRRQGGTHLVWLDADEAFTSQFLPQFRHRLARMQRGQKLVLDWLCLWKNPRHLRSDQSIWSVLPKDFVFCDDGTSAFDGTRLHERRTPGTNDERRLIRIPRTEGAVLHFQFVPFQRYQTKQAFLRCQEWLHGTGSAAEINAKYAITLDDPRAFCQPVPPEWLEGLTGLDQLVAMDDNRYRQPVIEMFHLHGILHFEPLAIWHIPEFLEQFHQTEHRDPHPVPPSWSWRVQQPIKNRLRPLSVLLHRWPK